MKLRTVPHYAAVLAFSSLCHASDHADPMSLNVFKLQEDPAANITDLHAFLVNEKGVPTLTQEGVKDADQLVISLCVRRRLLPEQIANLDSKEKLTQYSFRVHLDLDPEIRFFNPEKTRDGQNYDETVRNFDAEILTASKTRDATHNLPSPQGKTAKYAESVAQMRLDDLVAKRRTLVEQHQQGETMQRLYGGIIDNPSGIAEEALLDFHLNFNPDGENSEATLNEELYHIVGIPGKINVMTEGRRSTDGTKDIVTAKPWIDGAINVQAGVFDDPFIFPRFFRSNAVGIVTSIPLKLLRRPDGSPASRGPILLWGTTHRPDGKQCDHVGRSLRTQLPRFGYLNELPPSKHIAEIMRVHASPTLMENTLATFLSPLEAHRHYDFAPDVMIFDLTKPAKFPNGRWLADDISKSLADAGETLLFELSYAESKQMPRAETNDKEFRATFPYLAHRWTKQQIADFAAPGARFGDFDMGRSNDPPEAHDTTVPGTMLTGMRVPDSPDRAAIAPPDLNIAVWKSIWLGLLITLFVLGSLVFFLSRGFFPKLSVVVVAFCALCAIHPIKAARLPNTDPEYMKQPVDKFHLLLGGTGAIAFLALWIPYALGIRRGINTAAAEQVMPLGEQRPQDADYQYDGTSFAEVYEEVFKEPYYGNTWGDDSEMPLPVYKTTFAGVARGMFSLSKRFLFLDAAQRTLASHADLRKGIDGKGVERLIHPNGICLAGNWKIASDCPTDYTGYFTKGSEGLLIARYSSGLGVRRGQKRTLSMVGKLYPTTERSRKERTASFITQEDLGAAYSEGIHDAVLRNAPDITFTKRFPNLATLFLFAFTFSRADTRNSERQLYEIAELGKPADIRTKCPRFMQLTVNDELSPKVGGGDETADFRDEVLTHIYERGISPPARKLVFDIEVSDAGEVRGLLNKSIQGAVWTKIGTLEFAEAAASYNGDFVIHFHHPRWRLDRNIPNSETGPSKLFVSINRAIAGINGILGIFVKK